MAGAGGMLTDRVRRVGLLSDFGNGIQDFWGGLGGARGYVVGAAVTFVGVLVNIRAIRKSDKKKAEQQTTREHAVSPHPEAHCSGRL